jgi:excisionase family DNA binding protein
MADDDLLTVSDVATRLRVNEETVRDWLRRKELHGYNLGGRAGWRVPTQEVDRFLAARTDKRPSATSRAPEVR